jgi:hypothetical protein
MSLQELRTLALEADRIKHPNLPEYARYIKPYSDKTANGLTRCIIDWLRLNGDQAERIAVTGRYIDNSRIVTDVIGRRRRIGSGQWIRPSMQPGSADLSATINGRSVKIEIKMLGDRQSKAQKEYQRQVERAGGVYIIASSFAQFFDWYQKKGACHE